MQELAIRLFGSMEVNRGPLVLPGFPTQKTKSLFRFLVLNGERIIHRDLLCGRFWGDLTDREARKALRTALWRIRSIIEPEKSDQGVFLYVDNNHVGFKVSDRVWVDAWEFESYVKWPPTSKRQDLCEVEVERLERAASLYRGDLLEGCYEEWCLVEQDRFRLAYLCVLEQLMRHHRLHHRWMEAIMVGKRLLQHDPLREHIHRSLMECHLRSGDRPSALRQYGECVHSLKEELDIEPMEETRLLYDRIRSEETTSDDGLTLESKSSEPEIERLTEAMEVVLRDLHSLTARLEQARSTTDTRSTDSFPSL